MGLILSLSLVSQIAGQEIHQAVIEGKFEIVQKMLEEDRDFVSAVDSDEKMPLHLAAEHGHIHVIGKSGEKR